MLYRQVNYRKKRQLSSLFYNFQKYLFIISRKFEKQAAMLYIFILGNTNLKINIYSANHKKTENRQKTDSPNKFAD